MSPETKFYFTGMITGIVLTLGLLGAAAHVYRMVAP